MVLRATKASLYLYAGLVGPLIWADDFRTNDGKQYNNVTVSRDEPDGIVVTSSTGIVKLYFTELPQDVRDRFHYDPAKAEAFSKAQQEIQAKFSAQKEAQSKAIAEQRKSLLPSSSPTTSVNRLQHSSLDAPAYNRTISAEQLFSEFARNEITANRKYRGTEWIISGTIKTIEAGELAPWVQLNVNGGDNVYFMRAQFPKGDDDLAKYKVGGSISFSGVISGIKSGTLQIVDCSVRK